VGVSVSDRVLLTVVDGLAEIALIDAVGRNALSEELVAELLEKLDRVSCDPNVNVVVLRGQSDVFCSGAPRRLLLDLVSGKTAPVDIVLSKRMLDLPVPVIAAMEGHAVGGGLALGLCADIVLLAEESRYGCNFMDMGFTPGMGITRLLEHVLSPALAFELMMTGELRRGVTFKGNSGINYVLPRSEIWLRAQDLALRIAEKPRKALTMLKRTLSLPRRQAFEATFTLETLMHEVSFAAPDARQRIEDDYAAA
jgi:polyketide biosynthesis enoyl-CoA hydratase PksI